MDTLVQKLANTLKQGVLFLYTKFVEPRSADEDARRREFILNILLVSSILFTGVLLCIIAYNSVTQGAARKGIAPFVVVGILATFIMLWILSRRGMHRLSAVIFLALYALPVSYALHAWGADLPQGILSCALIIVMSSILISTRFAFVVGNGLSCMIIYFTLEQVSGIDVPSLSWKTKPTTLVDSIAVVVTLGMMTIVSWLSNREIEKSLQRARTSEAALREERDLLEVKVEERTRDLKRTQIEKTAQMYRFVEFGRLAAGFYHDLASPLTAVTLNLQQLKSNNRIEMGDTEKHLERALTITGRLESFLLSVRKQVQHQETLASFSIKEEMEHILQTLGHKAKKAAVNIVVSDLSGLGNMYSNPHKVNQVLTNLISNAIDAYEDAPQDGRTRDVQVTMSIKNEILQVEVHDHACGMSPDTLSKIFEPFFTTKQTDRGMGIGLATTKDVVENYFHGQIEVKSILGEGSSFFVRLPVIRP